MEDRLEKKIELKDKIISFYNENKIKIFSIVFILSTAIAIFIFLEMHEKKNNKLISEKYVQAGLYLASNDKEKAKDYYNDIILSKNKFYSILALNTILEKNLVTERNIILSYFQKLENYKFSRETSDLITLKKALYLIKISEEKSGNELLKKLITEKSSLKSIAQEIISK